MTTANVKNYDRVAKFFDCFRAGDMRRWGPAQKSLFSRMEGRSLYIGIGTGFEIVNFPPGQDITAIDLSPQMLERARPRAESYPGKMNLCLMDSQRLGFPDDSFDTAVAVCVFCTVKDPVAGLREVKRVLKPGGRLLMFEHVLSKNPVYGLSLKFMSWFTEWLEGTHLDRHTVENVRKAGFAIESEKNVYLDIVKTIRATPEGHGSRP